MKNAVYSVRVITPWFISTGCRLGKFASAELDSCAVIKLLFECSGTNKP